VTTTRRRLMAGGALLTAAAVTKLAHAQQVPAPKSAADVPGTPPGTLMTKELRRRGRAHSLRLGLATGEQS
jgi:hypothetical protein